MSEAGAQNVGYLGGRGCHHLSMLDPARRKRGYQDLELGVNSLSGRFMGYGLRQALGVGLVGDQPVYCTAELGCFLAVCKDVKCLILYRLGCIEVKSLIFGMGFRRQPR